MNIGKCGVLPVIYKLVFALALSMLIIPFSSVPAQEKSKDGQARLIVMSSRTVRDALWILEQQLGCVITYEDPKFKHPDSVSEVFPGGYVVPRTRTLSFAYDSISRGEPLAVRTTIQELLEKYHQVDGTVKFQVIQSKVNARMFNVVPVFEKNEKGEVTATNPLLDANISLSMTDTYEKIVGEICKQVSNAPGGRRVGLSRPPTWNFTKIKITLNVKNASAITCLNALLNNYNLKEKEALSWSLDIDPRLDFAFLNFHRIQPVEPDKGFEQSVSVKVETARPLADASNLLEGELGKPIIYEDLPYLCSCQLWMNKAGEPQVPSGGIFDFSYLLKEKPDAVLAKATAAYNKHNRGKFMTKFVDNYPYVYPTEFLNEKAEILPHDSLLTTPISISGNRKPASAIIKTFCETLATQTKQKIILGQLSPLPAFNRSMTYEAATRPAIEHLIAISKQIEPNLSWQLLYEPRQGRYVLNGHLVKKRAITNKESVVPTAK